MGALLIVFFYTSQFIIFVSIIIINRQILLSVFDIDTIIGHYYIT